MGAVRHKLEAIQVVNPIAVGAPEAQAVAQNWRAISNEGEATQDTKATASMFADELLRVPEHGAGERRELLVARAAATAAKLAPSS